LQSPSLDAGFVPAVLVEQVSYLPSTPWPAGADGTGSSLQRLVGAGYANDPTNWFVAAPTAGQSNTNNPGDLNGDGLPDAWQLQYFSSINDPQAAPGADPDGDGFNNLQEYLAGTSPVNAGDYLKLDSVNASATDINIHFTAVAGKTYSVLWTGDLKTGTWNKLADVGPQGTTGPITVIDSVNVNNAQRFYRLVTPQNP
jgi:hypothetical protein